MRTTFSVLTLIALILLTFSSIAQPIDFLSFTKPDPNYRNCAAIFFDGKYLVDEIAPKGKCELFPNMAGVLTVANVTLSNEGAKQIKNIAFHVAIRNDRTHTMWLFTKEAVMELYLQDLIEKCEMGDRIIIMPADQQYSLPQHEIVLQFGC